MATENILMDAVKKGGDRQELHERIRMLSMEAGRRVKEEGLENDLLERIVQDDAFPLNEEDVKKLMRGELYIGRAKEQVEEFISEYIEPILKDNQKELNLSVEIAL